MCGEETVQMIRSRLEACRCGQSSSSSSVATYSSAPNSNASSLFRELRENASTRRYPIALANSTAKCPSPPNPTTPTLVCGPSPCSFNGSYTVLPAHNMTAASVLATPSGIENTLYESWRQKSAKPPWDTLPSAYRSPYVPTRRGQ